MTRSNAAWLIIVVLLALGYPVTYSALRLTHVLTHWSMFVSAEGLDAHTVHGMDGHEQLQTLFKPLVALELELHRRQVP